MLLKLQPQESSVKTGMVDSEKELLCQLKNDDLVQFLQKSENTTSLKMCFSYRNVLGSEATVT